jgi:hypothetical protein
MGTQQALAFYNFLNGLDNNTRIEELEFILNNPQTLRSTHNPTQTNYNLVNNFLRSNKNQVISILQNIRENETIRDQISMGKNIKLSKKYREQIISEIKNLYDIASKKKTKRRRIKKKETKRRNKKKKKI